MAILFSRRARLGATLISLAFLANCSPPPPVGLPPAPPPQDAVTSTHKPEQYGDQSGLLGGPAATTDVAPPTPSDGLIHNRRPDGVEVVSMPAIANPVAKATARHGHSHPSSAPQTKPQGKVGTSPMGAKPTAPHVSLQKPQARPVLQPAPLPKVIAPKVQAAKPVAVPPAVKLAAPKVETQKAPTPSIPDSLRMVPALAPTDARLAGLQSELLPDLAQGARFVVADGVAKGQAGPVTLTFPKALESQIRAKAARHGLGRPSRQINLTAKLSGTGYQIVPDTAQTIELSADKDTVFTWQVTPQPVARTPLHADLSASLVGAASPLALPLAGLEPKDAINPALAAVPPVKKGFHFQKAFHFQMPHLPVGISKPVGAVALLLAALGLLAYAARRSHDSQREADRRRREDNSSFSGMQLAERNNAPTDVHPPVIDEAAADVVDSDVADAPEEVATVEEVAALEDHAQAVEAEPAAVEEVTEAVDAPEEVAPVEEVAALEEHAQTLEAEPHVADDVAEVAAAAEEVAPTEEVAALEEQAQAPEAEPHVADDVAEVATAAEEVAPTEEVAALEAHAHAPEAEPHVADDVAEVAQAVEEVAPAEEVAALESPASEGEPPVSAPAAEDAELAEAEDGGSIAKMIADAVSDLREHADKEKELTS